MRRVGRVWLVGGMRGARFEERERVEDGGRDRHEMV